MLNPHRLVILQAVIAAGSVNSAARNLNYSPATISQHLAALSRETGLVLFEKDGRGIVPTPAAIQLAEHARTAVAGLERLDRTVADLRDGPTEQLAIACFSSLAQAWLPTVVTSIRRHHPHVTVEISLNEPHGGHGRRRADLDIRNEPSNGPEIHLDGYRRAPLIVEDFYAVIPIEHRLSANEVVALGELRDEAWIDHDIYDSPTGQIISTACTAAGFTPRYAARLDDHHAAIALVEAGVGITVLPHLALTGLPSRVSVKPLTHPTINRRIVAHASTDTHRSQLVTETLTALRSLAAEHATRGDAHPEGLSDEQ